MAEGPWPLCACLKARNANHAHRLQSSFQSASAAVVDEELRHFKVLTRLSRSWTYDLHIIIYVLTLVNRCTSRRPKSDRASEWTRRRPSLHTTWCRWISSLIWNSNETRELRYSAIACMASVALRRTGYCSIATHRFDVFTWQLVCEVWCEMRDRLGAMQTGEFEVRLSSVTSFQK